MIKHCNTCALRTSNETCGLGRYKVTPEADYCSHHQDNPVACEICHVILITPGIIDLQNDSPHLICGECLQKMKTCALCDFNKVCSFDSSTSGTPKTVKKVIQKGPMQAVVEVKNPDRIQETCKKDCSCWNEEYGCLRENGSCGKVVYTYVERES